MSNSSIDRTSQRTAMVAVTTMEELPLPTEAQQNDMRASLKAAEAEVKAGHFAEHDPETFVDRLMSVRDAAAHAKRS